ncbi:MAG: hypothetical protein RLZZ200_637, partial [Pseudomonadota bacterium]
MSEDLTAAVRSEAVYEYLLKLQTDLCATFGGPTLGGEFQKDVWQREGTESTIGGRGIT